MTAATSTRKTPHRRAPDRIKEKKGWWKMQSDREVKKGGVSKGNVRSQVLHRPAGASKTGIFGIHGVFAVEFKLNFIFKCVFIEMN